MKELFPRCYFDPKELQALWEESLFVLDANVLLRLYELTEASRNRIIEVFEKIADRLWVPHQAAAEYQKNRVRVMEKQREKADEFISELRRLPYCIDRILPEEHPLVDKEIKEKLKKAIADACEEAKAELHRRRNAFKKLLEHDTIRERLDVLLAGRVGEPYDTDKLIKITEIAEKRYKAKIPPGYADENKNGGNPYGDVILWFQIIDKARAEKRPVIFVTNDRKEDWWITGHSGEPLFPRHELVDELRQKAGVTFYMYTLKKFLEDVNIYLKFKLSTDVIKELEQLAEQECLKALGQVWSSAEALSKWADLTRQVLSQSASWRIADVLQQVSKETAIWRHAAFIQDLLDNIKPIGPSSYVWNVIRGFGSSMPLSGGEPAEPEVETEEEQNGEDDVEHNNYETGSK